MKEAERPASLRWRYVHIASLLGCIAAQPLHSQLFVRDYHPTAVSFGTAFLRNPLAGGFQTPILQLVDIDGDGRSELITKDRDGVLRSWTNDGARFDAQWILREGPLVDGDVPDWFRFADIDGDGDQDLFTGANGSTVMLHLNIGSAQSMILTPYGEIVREKEGSPVISELASIPAFADVDGDGDLDFFGGNSIGSMVFYENIGSTEKAVWEYSTDQYQNILIVGFGGGGRVAQKRSDVLGGGRIVHGAMSVTFGDIDNDGDLDILWGDFFSPSLYHLRNDGTPTLPFFVLVDSTFPDSHPSISAGFNMPALADLDGDGDQDLAVGVVSGFASTGNLLLFRNEGIAGSPDFQLITTNPQSVLDVGADSKPSVGDVTGDGIDDLVIGEAGGSIRMLRGLPREDILAFDDSLDALLTLPGAFTVAPSVVDVDGDGISELLVGDFNGRVRLYRRLPEWQEDASFSVRDLSFGNRAVPAAGDLDGDGDTDIVVGNAAGKISVLERTNAAGSGSYLLRGDIFAQVDVGENAAPVLADIDGDGDTDLLVGSHTEGLRLWINGPHGYIPYEYEVLESGRLTDLAPAILRSGTELSMLAGNALGGIVYFRRTPAVIPPLSSVSLLSPYPNPVVNELTVQYVLPTFGDYALSIYDVLGRRVSGGEVTGRGVGFLQTRFQLAHAASGMYVVGLRTAEGSFSRRFVVVR